VSDVPSALDVVVIGGGPAGVTAALRARALGASVALVERGSLGGTCTNDGCVPTRVLARAARLIRDIDDASTFGLVGDRPQLDFAALMTHTQRVVYRIHEKKQLEAHLAGSGVDVRTDTGEARFVDPHTVQLADGTRLMADRFVISAGGTARRLPIPGAEHAITHSDVWRMRTRPRSLAIVGAAATGCQLASVFEAFGSDVTILDLAPRLLANEDEVIGDVVSDVFERRGIRVRTGIDGVRTIERRDAHTLRVAFGAGGEVEELDVEAVIVAIGWPGNLAPLGLDAAGVATERGYVVVDDELRTSAPHIYAAGDITGRMMLVQGATHEARAAAENAVGDAARRFRHHIVPHGGFTDPEYGSVGLTERAARERGDDVAVAVVPYGDLDRAVIDDRTDGACKLIASTTSRRILGAHVVGEQAVEVVQLVAAGMAAGMTIDAMADLELAYPTFTSVVGLAARRLSRLSSGSDPLDEWERRAGPEVAGA
jgi:pyruvate/2-oxoglutarate dehydrogenase complex dihydrolipoamide dehydrogenase (E3) component